MTINLTQAKKEQILDNMIQLHSNMSEAECVDIRSYCFFSKQLPKLVEKIYKKSHIWSRQRMATGVRIHHKT